MRVCVLIPWRGGCAHRDAALAHVRTLYRRELPTASITLGIHAAGEWCKAHAIDAALALADDADAIVIADGDVWAPSVVHTINAVLDGHEWGTPHRTVRRLSREGQTAEKHPAVVGGGIVVLRPETLRDCPPDHRFKGWGGEDVSWGFALRTLHPNWTRGDDELVHHWHPPQPRRSRSCGSPANETLRERYRAALNDPDRMRALLEEARDAELATDRSGRS